MAAAQTLSEKGQSMHLRFFLLSLSLAVLLRLLATADREPCGSPVGLDVICSSADGEEISVRNKLRRTTLQRRSFCFAQGSLPGNRHGQWLRSDKLCDKIRDCARCCM